jgi:surface polysaccharide O-acyltransferase-like enzyme
MKTRLKEFDYLRVTAVLAVITIHITSIYVTVNSVAYLMNQIARFAVPIFIILSGFLLYYSDINRQGDANHNLLFKRLNKVFIPYAIWTLIYMLYSVRHNLEAVLSTSFFIALARNLMLGKAAPQLYFIIIILQMYLLYGLLKRLMDSKYEKHLITAAFVVTAFINLGAYLFRWNIFIMPKISIGYYILFPTWLFYFVFGMHFAKHESRYKEFLLSARIKMSFIYLASFAALYADSRLSNTYGSSMKPTIMLYCFASFLFFYSVFSSSQVKEIPLIRWISEQSFFIFFSHVVLIELIRSFFHITGIPIRFHSILGVLLLFILDTCASFLLAFIISYLPFSKYLGCTPKRIQAQNKTKLSI